MKSLCLSLLIAAVSSAGGAPLSAPLGKAEPHASSPKEFATPPAVDGKANPGRVAAVPEPSVIVPLVCGLGALILLGRRRG